MGVLPKFKRRSYSSSKFFVKINPSILVINVEAGTAKPEKVVVTFMRGARRHKCKARNLEESYSFPNRGLVTWPDVKTTSNGDALFFPTTLYLNKNHYLNKKWTIIIEDSSHSNGHKPIAAISFDISLIAKNVDIPAEITINLRPLINTIESCVIVFKISLQLVDAINNDHIINEDLILPRLKESREENALVCPIEQGSSSSNTVNFDDAPQISYKLSPPVFNAVSTRISDEIDTETIKINPNSPPNFEGRFCSYLELTEQEKIIVQDVEIMRKIRDGNLEQFDTSIINENGNSILNKDFKILKMAQPQISIRHFQKHVPNSAFVRDNDNQAPSLPFSNITERAFYTGSPSTPNRVPKHAFKTTSQNDSFFNNTIGNFARIGSARGHEFMNSLANLVPSTSSSLPRPIKKSQRELENTPTRKLSTRFSLIKSDQIPEELSKIEWRMIEIDNFILNIDEKLRNNVRNEDEQKLIEEKHNYVKEKDKLLSRQDILNKSLDFHETNNNVNCIKQRMNEILTDDDAIDRKEEREALALELRKETDRLNELQLEIEDSTY